jgi:uncharacterized protein Yka (UPF0111/DUF47 family)
MKINFLPRDERFKDWLISLGSLSHQSAQMLNLYVSAESTQEREEGSNGLVRCKGESELIWKELTLALHDAFVTPYDHEDIQHIATALNDMPHRLQRLRHRIEIYGLTYKTETFKSSIAALMREAEATAQMVDSMFSDPRGYKVAEHYDVLGSLATRSDDIVESMLENVILDIKDTHMLVLQKDIAELIIKNIERYRHISYEALQIILKHS